VEEGGPVGEKEANKPPSPKPDTEESADVAPPLVTKETTDLTDAPAEDNKDDKGGKKASATKAPAKNKTKNTVLTGEAMKEMAKQAKQNKDERRMQMDARHKYLLEQLANALNLDQSAVEEFMVSDDRFDMMEDFFKAEGSRKIMFFYQDVAKGNSDKKKLFITPGDAEGLHGICLYFLRTAPKAITPQNIAQEVNFGTMDCTGGKILSGFEKHLSKIVLPALKSLEQWGTLSRENGSAGQQVEDFLENLEKFVNSLMSALKNMEGQVHLQENGHSLIIDKIKTPADYQDTASNTDHLEKLEELLTMWAKQIEQVLAESEQMRREADDIGPTAELAYWKSRMAKFNNLLEQMKNFRVKAVVGVLQVSKSKTLKKWKDLDSRITDAANEAKDNVKYLYTLEKFFGPLVKCTPATMIEHIPSLMNAIRMIYSISQYYNTSERMTSLFVKVTNQMITTSKAYIYQDVSKIWEHKREELLKRLDECINLNIEYQKQFQKTKEKLRETPNERQFEFSENYIFGKFDTFCKRLEKIKDMINTMEQFAGLPLIKIEGIDTLIVRYKTIVDTTKKKNYDILDHRKGEFESDYVDFKSQVDNLRNSIQAFMDSWFSRSLSTEKALELLDKFEAISAAQLDLTDKYMRVLTVYGRDLESIRKVYQKHKNDPMIPRNLPPIAGKIAWARQLYRKIETPMKIFKNKAGILKHPESKKTIRNFNKMAGVLLEY